MNAVIRLFFDRQFFNWVLFFGNWWCIDAIYSIYIYTGIWKGNELLCNWLYKQIQQKQLKAIFFEDGQKLKKRFMSEVFKIFKKKHFFWWLFMVLYGFSRQAVVLSEICFNLFKRAMQHSHENVLLNTEIFLKASILVL